MSVVVCMCVTDCWSFLIKRIDHKCVFQYESLLTKGHAIVRFRHANRNAWDIACSVFRIGIHSYKSRGCRVRQGKVGWNNKFRQKAVKHRVHANLLAVIIWFSTCTNTPEWTKFIKRTVSWDMLLEAIQGTLYGGSKGKGGLLLKLCYLMEL